MALRKLLSGGSGSARVLMHAQVLLRADRSADGPALSDVAIAKALDIGKNTIPRIRRRYVDAGVEAALHRRPSQRVYQRKLDGDGEARLIAVVCSAAPAGRATWTMQLLADRLVVLQVVDSISDETVRRTLKKTASNRG